jgi:hypothetical protein
MFTNKKDLDRQLEWKKILGRKKKWINSQRWETTQHADKHVV